ncbi:hypothetical protein [Streptomyces sp. NPDC018045]|uniref:hypothetical protein n=1 Tax=Streptomyces sp. NPDC018045 TaxID=3365037 RepID=UPI00379FE843
MDHARRSHHRPTHHSHVPRLQPYRAASLRHLHRLDACLLTLAGNLGVPAAPKYPSRTADGQK